MMWNKNIHIFSQSFHRATRWKYKRKWAYSLHYYDAQYKWMCAWNFKCFHCFVWVRSERRLFSDSKMFKYLWRFLFWIEKRRHSYSRSAARVALYKFTDILLFLCKCSQHKHNASNLLCRTNLSVSNTDGDTVFVTLKLVAYFRRLIEVAVAKRL